MFKGLEDDEIHAVLAAGNLNTRSRKRPLNSLTIDYERKVRKGAEAKLAKWRELGVIEKEYSDLVKTCPLLIPRFNLQLANPTQSERVNTNSRHQSCANAGNHF